MNVAKKTVMLIDPPSGWKYGFPKPIDLQASKGRVLEWLVEQGYPQAEIDACGDHFYSRYWETEIEENDDEV
jgi:hypothetical protein